jgi:hypothetical protein
MGNMSKVVSQLSKERARLKDELHRVTAALTAFGKVYLSGSNPNAANHTKRTISAAGRKRISLAQKKRWAKARGRASKRKRTISLAGKKRIAAAQRLRWAKLKAGQKKAA